MSYPKNYSVNFFNLEYLKDFFEKFDSKMYVVIDENVYELYRKYFENLDSKRILSLVANEDLKTFEGIKKVCQWLLNNDAKKDSIILGIGGGVIQDICTFVAHIYYRGIEWIYLPTTLLSQCDSCIGAKCGINFGNFKNQLGVIHAPSQVLVDINFLNTLSDVDVYSGLGEMLKLSLTGPNEFYDYFCENTKGATLDYEELIFKSLNAKKPIIEADEFENDLRRILNYGHSFGHALEHSYKGVVPHGLAVVWGIDLINYIGYRLGITPLNLFEDIRSNSNKIFSFKLPYPPEVENLFEALSRDKKIKNNKMNFAILENIGKINIVPKHLDSELKNMVNEYLKSNYVFRPS